MKWTGLALALLVCACGVRQDDDPERVLETAEYQFRYGDLDQSLRLTERGIDLTRHEPQSLASWNFKLLLGEILLTRRKVGDAETRLRDIPPAASAFAGVRARHKYLEGQLLVLRGELTTAIPVLETAETLAIAAGAEPVVFSSQALRGQALLRLGRGREGTSVLGTLAADAERSGDDYHLALALINLGRDLLGRYRYDEALAYLERAVALERVTPRIRAAALTNAGLCYTRLGDVEHALTVQRQAVAAHEKSAPVFLEQALGELGSTYVLKGDFEQAVANLSRALQVATESKLNEDAAVWAGNLTETFIALREWEKAEEFNLRARGLAGPAEPSRMTPFVLNDADIAAGRGLRARARELYKIALGEAGLNPFDTFDAHGGLARVAVAEGRLPEAVRHFDAALRVIETAQANLLKTDYKFTYLRRIFDVYGDYIDALMAQRQFDRALEVADSSRARVLAERHGVIAGRRHTAAEFRRVAAQSGRTLLAYWLGAEQSYAWAITPKAIKAITLPRASEIEPLARAHQKAVVDALADPVRAAGTPGEALYTMLVAPFASELKPGAGVVIVPDGALSQVSFETLPVPGPTRHYWIEDVVLAVAPSLGTLAAGSSPQKPRAERSVLLVGDPLPADEYPKLQYASAEIDGVARAFPDARKAILRGKDASPRAFGAAHPEDFSLIHFTAHASANAESPLDSAVILSPDASGYKLYARDIAEQALNADLVTISACRSAGDRTYSGEGLVGFAWAFLRAGARRVLAGLWDVDDRSTAELMTATYAGLARKESPAAALRAAKLAIIKRGGAQAKPYYWGPFQLVVATP